MKEAGERPTTRTVRRKPDWDGLDAWTQWGGRGGSGGRRCAVVSGSGSGGGGVGSAADGGRGGSMCVRRAFMCVLLE